MKSAPVGYLILAIIIILLLSLSPPSHRNSNHLRVSRRLGHKHAPFDPLIGKLEILMEENGLKDEKVAGNWDMDESVSRELSESEEYFKEDGMLNITERLLNLFPLLDKFPQDGFINLKELEAWNVDRAVERLNYKTMKEMKLRDKDGNGSLSLIECLHPSLTNLERNDMAPDQVGWWKEQFRNADEDGNGLLNLSELNDFLNPKDSANEEIHELFLREKIRLMDYDKDGKLNFVEFREQAYKIYKTHAEYDYNGYDIPKPEEKFADLDLNFDRLLTVQEMLPMMHQLYPGEITYAIYYAKYLIREADDDKDGKLTIDEILNHEEVFYSKVFESEFDDNNDNDDDDDFFHEEF
ncbi:hypothetical protein NE237_010113 [Protea cynaroides]|uniref:EF-hand domain-containing protein n=1 Tax=Protea cynaroides TaxID=273540 RepID=A0A9Q0R0Y0_9MAGN|nr:hypothetical protein NE237_010113 [Protea cynaroides]